MNKKIIILIFVAVSIFGQTKLQNKKIVKDKLKLSFNTSINYTVKANNNKNVFHVKNYQDESAPGDVRLPSNDIFISLPKVGNPKVKYTILSKKAINAIPEFNEVVELNSEKELVYSKAKVLKNSKNKHYNIKGYLWIENNYCLHLEIIPAIFISSENVIEIVDKFEIELTFDDELNLSNALQKKSARQNIISNSRYTIQNLNNRFKITSDDSWIDYSKQYVKIGTAQDGIYRIHKNNLENLGVNTTSINPKTFRLLLRGEEVPIFVEGESDFSFDGNDYIEFVGVRNMGGKHRELSGYNEPYNEYLGRYTDTTVYWLTWDGVDGERVDISDGNEVTTTDTLDYYSQIEHHEKNNWFDFSCASLVRRETPFWIENKTWIEGGIGIGVRNKPFSVSNLKLNKNVNAYVKLQDWVSNISSKAHHYALSFNADGKMYDSTYVNKYEKAILHAEFSSSKLSEGSNTLRLHSFETSASLNNSFLDWYEIEYPRYLIPFNDSLNFSFPFLTEDAPQIIYLQNINTNSFVIWKYGTEFKKFNLNKSGDNVIFVDSVSADDKFAFIDESKIRTPKIYYDKKFINLRNSENKADYIAITHKKFKAKVNEYAQFISDNYNLKAIVVDVDDIYDEFGYGFFNPEVIKDFLKSTHNNWQSPKPRSVALIGGATYDYYGNKYNNFSAVSKRVLNYVPSYGASVSDNWFVNWDTTGAYIPQMNIGRIPVTTNEELDWYFEKHRDYVSQKYDDWNKNYMFFSGGNENKPSEMNSMKEANQYVIDNITSPKPVGGNSTHFYKTVNPSTNFGHYTSEYIQDIIDNGAVYISYVGHSGTQTWDNSITNPSQLKNNMGRYPVVSDFGCSTGRFAEPDVVSFSQLFTLDSEGQALGYIGNSSLGFVSTSLLMPKLFYKKILLEDIYTVSEAHKEAKIEMLQTYGSTGIYELFSLTNTLIGDPVLTLPIPQKPNFVIRNEDISLKTDLLTDLQDSVNIKFLLNNWGMVPNDSLDILLVQEYNSSLDSSFLKVEIPSFQDSLSYSFIIKNMAGNHVLRIILDPTNKFDEISKNDNSAEIAFNVASSSIRPIVNTQFFNGVGEQIKFLNPTSKPVNETIIVEVSQNSDFINSENFEIPFDSLVSQFNINSLDNRTRYWGRTKISGDNNYSTAFAFSNNNEKHILFDSLGFGKTKIENLNTDHNSLKIDTTKMEFEIYSAGFSDGNTALILKDKTNYMFDATLRGHYISTFRNSDYEFVESKVFDLLGGGSAVANKYYTFLDTVSSNLLLMFAIKDEGAVSLSSSLRNKIKEFGSTKIDSVNFRASWAFMGKRGATPGTMPEAVSHEGDGPVSIDTTISFLSEKGSLLTTEIGPTGKWDKLVVSQELPSNSAITYRPIGIREDGILDTLAELALQDSVADLSGINTELYSKIKILADFTASDDKQSPVLKSLGVDYTDVAELAINYQVVSVEKDSITQGEKNKLSFFIYNVGETKADSFSVKVELQKPDNSSLTLKEFITSIDSSSKEKFEYDFEILNSFGFGNMAYTITIDGDAKITEFFEDNNFFQIPFFVKKDTSTAVNDSRISKVTFDDVEIMDWKGGSDFVSNSPTIVFKLSDKANQASAEIKLDNVSIVESVDYDSSNKTYSFKPKPGEEIGEGEHSIYFSIPIDGISNTKVDTLIDFTVSNELEAKDIYNYPNPASSETYFTFRLAMVPEALDIKIYTVAGRLIKTLEFQSYDLRNGINKKYWDLRDQDGDEIANGVYLYKIILKDKDKVEYYTQKLAIVK